VDGMWSGHCGEREDLDPAGGWGIMEVVDGVLVNGCCLYC
jgi:hypothetical protein